MDTGGASPRRPSAVSLRLSCRRCRTFLTSIVQPFRYSHRTLSSPIKVLPPKKLRSPTRLPQAPPFSFPPPPTNVYGYPYNPFGWPQAYSGYPPDPNAFAFAYSHHQPPPQAPHGQTPHSPSRAPPPLTPVAPRTPQGPSSIRRPASGKKAAHVPPPEISPSRTALPRSQTSQFLPPGLNSGGFQEYQSQEDPDLRHTEHPAVSTSSVVQFAACLTAC